MYRGALEMQIRIFHKEAYHCPQNKAYSSFEISNEKDQILDVRTLQLAFL